MNDSIYVDAMTSTVDLKFVLKKEKQKTNQA